MKKILSFIALAIAVAVTFSSCDNKPPYIRLAAAIDSLNAQYEAAHNTTEKLITYEKLENVVVFNTTFPVVIEDDVFEPLAANIKEKFIQHLVTDNEFNIAYEIIDAKANTLIKIHGLNDTEYEVLITTNELDAAYTAAREAEAVEPAAVEEEAPDTLTAGEVEQELLEGNAPSVK